MHPGQTVQGTILVDVKSRVKGGIINLSIVHKEEVRYTSTQSATDDRMASSTLYKDDVVVVHAVVDLDNMNQQWVEKGTYAMSFQIRLPKNIPATMKFGNDHDGCSIQYKLVASMGRLRSEFPLVVKSNPLTNIQTPFLTEPKAEKVRTMGFCRDGHFTIGARLDRRTVGRGQLLYLSLACVNTTPLELESVTITLVELIRMTCHSSTFYRKVTLADMKVIELSGLIMRIARTDWRNAIIKPPTSELTSDIQRIDNALAHGKNAISISIPTVSATGGVSL